MKRFSIAMIAFALAVCTFVPFVFAANKWGDVNSDGETDISDSVILAQYLAGWNISLSADEGKSADVFYDGVIDTKDAVLLAQYLAGWKVVLGDGENEKDGEIEDLEIDMNDLCNEKLVIYPEFPDKIRRIYDYDVSVTMGDRTEKLPVYNHTDESDISRGTSDDHYRRFSMFAFEGGHVRVDIKVKQDFRSYTVFPSAKNFRNEFKDGVISVYLDKPDYFGIRLDDDYNTILSVFADYPEDEAQIPERDAPNTVYIDGWYETDNGALVIDKDNTTLYIAPGAVLNCRVKITANNCRVYGRGAILDPYSNIYEYDIRVGQSEGKGSKLLELTGKGCIADGPVLLDARCYNVALYGKGHHTVRNIKAMSTMMTTDGFSTLGVDCTIRHCYLYIGDNCMTGLYSTTVRDVTCGTTCSVLTTGKCKEGCDIDGIYIFRVGEYIVKNCYNGGNNPGLKQVESNITARNIYATDCTYLNDFLASYNIGSLEKKYYFENVFVPEPSRYLLNLQNTEKDLLTENHDIVIKNMYFGDKPVLSTDGYNCPGIEYNNKITFEAGSVTPPKQNKTTVNYSAGDKVYIGSMQAYFTALERKDGVLMMPSAEISKLVRRDFNTDDEFVSAETLKTANVIESYSYSDGNLYITPKYDGENLLLPDEGEISRFTESRCYDDDLVVTKDADGYIYNVMNIDTAITGVARSITNEIRMYGTGTYRVTFKIKSDSESKIKVRTATDTNNKDKDFVIGTEWKTVTVDITVTDSMLKSSKVSFLLLSIKDYLINFAFRDMTLVKIK